MLSASNSDKFSLALLNFFNFMPEHIIKTFFTGFSGIQSLSLLLMILFLPLLEGPKTVFLILFIALALSRFAQRKILSFKKLKSSDYLLLTWILIGFVVAGFVEIHHKEWSGARSAMLIPLLLFCVKNSQFTNKEITLFLITAIISTLLASAEGLWKLYSHQKSALELNSVGHVNHSSVYLCITYAVVLAITLTQRPSNRWLSRLLPITLVIVLSYLVIISDSRGSALAMGVITLFYGLIWTKKSKKPLLIMLLASLVLIGGLYIKEASIVKKTLSQTTSQSSFNSLSGRIPLWNSALLIWRHNPVFGVGIKNFDQATQERQKNWLAEENKIYSDKIYHPYPHGHSLYFNTLAEQGIVGFSVIFINLFYVCYLLYLNTPKREAPSIYWLLWLSATGTMQVVLINGIFNTTLHHEHGLLSVLIIGLWWSRIKEPVLGKACKNSFHFIQHDIF
jgi:O-antigen ligase